jgi:hypothetical protein
MYLVSTCIQHQISVTVSTSDDMKRHSSNFKMATVLEVLTKEVRSVFVFMGKIFPIFVIYCELMTVYGGNVIIVQHVR